jgi:septum formation topological specificity factor MinE
VPSRDDTRKELRLLQWRADNKIRAVFEELAPEVADLVVSHAEKGADGVAVTTPAGHARIMQDLSPLLDAHRRVYRGAVNDMMERLPQDLRDVIRKANP